MPKKDTSTSRQKSTKTTRAKRGPSITDRARAIARDEKGYNSETREAIGNTLEEYKASEATRGQLAELVAHAEAGETILDATAKGRGARASALRLPLDVPASFTRYARPDDVQAFVRTGRTLARILEDEECPEAFQRAVGALFIDRILNLAELDLAEPFILRALLPLALIEIQGEGSGAAFNFVHTFITLRDSLVPASLVERALAETHAAPEADGDNQQLAELLAAVVSHPRLPGALYNALVDGLNEAFAGVATDVDTSAAYIRQSLDALEGRARRV